MRNERRRGIKIDQKRPETSREKTKPESGTQSQFDPSWSQLICWIVLIPVAFRRYKTQKSGEEWGNKRWEGGELWRSGGVLSTLVLVYIDQRSSYFSLHTSPEVVYLPDWIWIPSLAPWPLGVCPGFDAHARIAIGIRVDASAYFPRTKEKNMFGLGFEADEILWDLPNWDVYMKLVQVSIPRYRPVLTLAKGQEDTSQHVSI